MAIVVANSPSVCSSLFTDPSSRRHVQDVDVEICQLCVSAESNHVSDAGSDTSRL